MTSNYRPDDLYPNGLQRQSLLPTIALIKQWLDVIEIDGGIDYRLRALEQGVYYYTAARGKADAELGALFDRMRPGTDEDPRLVIEARTLKAQTSGGERRLVRFRHPLRRAALATRLPGACPPFCGGHRVRRAAFDRGHGQRRAALYLARRRALRSSGKVTGVGGRTGGGALRGGPEQPGISAYGQPAHRDAHARVHGIAALRRRRHGGRRRSDQDFRSDAR